jgi:IS605 OrfB family transposase
LKPGKVSEVKRTNTFIIEDCPALWKLADSCAKLYNELNFERRQAYMRYRRFEYPKHLYEKYAPLIGSATAQQIINKNNEAWRSFLALKRLEAEGKLPEHEKPPARGGSKPLYIDLGVINLATIWFEGLKQPVAYSGKAVLSDWWYWTGKIAREQSRLARVNRARTSKKLRKLYRIRQKFRHAVNAMVKAIVEYAYKLGISKIILGRLGGVRSRRRNNSKANAMINNFWSFSYIIRRFREKAEEYGMEVDEKSEYRTSSICPRCHSEDIITRGRLLKCLSCGLEANRDAAGVLNIGYLYGGSVNGVVAHPLLLRWNGMRWEPKRAVNSRPMKALEARISRL